jgi:hypothetical protein
LASGGSKRGEAWRHKGTKARRGCQSQWPSGTPFVPSCLRASVPPCLLHAYVLILSNKNTDSGPKRKIGTHAMIAGHWAAI